MNDQKFEAKMEKDGTNVKKAFATLIGDGASQLKDEYEHFSTTIQDTASETTDVIKKNFDHGMKQYNSKVQEVADRFAGGISMNVSKYPWVVVSLGLVFGFILGIVLKPTRQTS